ncbi:MAG TPA: UDP-N-acetylglucosamine 1-carboxyvinyltransferase [Bacillota bacterium]|nr:UDP-N-acetylglucosamine 1-carboxyvinyltransferase [Candidatus Fermentithermobacillaceae bacterium]HOB30303.1 UDP-N-acetylglucosamine 1-carboxyvinyltransferase [Bacillota bacterium]HOK64088.1 UDP-N-acetylglucosamine 1-carboxyvinyltransferase [Bacillota bacterium]HOQ02725.1 UDP-N-acetylglucosamine 1-carboxyvinyltransferase [Bacillota bacterium]HPV13098.1 UDP-N-acetylglucosamine 1-carboxyvinyltransferase [Bacillota bacterium]
MHSIVITGGTPLNGKVACDGAKNAALPILAGALLTDGASRIWQVPDLADVHTMLDLLSSVGAHVERSDECVYVEASQLTPHVPYELARMMRASFLIMGPLLARLGEAFVPLPGGCAIGRRPVDLHLKGFEAMGATIHMDKGNIQAVAPHLHGADIYLDVPSVGATENIMMAACMAEGTTIIDNAAQEPEIVDLANFLNGAGARIRGAGTSRIKIEGVGCLKGADHTIIPDRIEAATYLVAGAATLGEVRVENVIPTHLTAVLAKLAECGFTIIAENSSIMIKSDTRPKPVSVKTLPYPGFPTDVQAPFASLCSLGTGTSIISETIFENRFGYVEELVRMGANIKVEGPNAIIEGVSRLEGANVQAGDLRGGAALCIAALAAEGTSHVTGVEHIERGYSDLVQKLRSLGAAISYSPDPEERFEVG